MLAGETNIGLRQSLSTFLRVRDPLRINVFCDYFNAFLSHVFELL